MNSNKNEQVKDLEHLHRKVSKFFHDNIGDKTISIHSIKKIQSGLTNDSYLVKTNKGKYQVRFSQSADGIDRDVEKSVLDKTTGYIYFDKDGNMIRKWMDGKTLSNAFIWRKINKVFFAINLLHTKDVKTTKKVDFTKYVKNNKHHEKKNELYFELLKEFEKDAKWVISHNDVNNKNIIVNRSKTQLIDFEWSKLNFEWFDLVYYLIHTHLSRHMLVKLASERIHGIGPEHFFFVSYFCLNWVHSIHHESPKFRRLQNKYARSASFFYHEVINYIKKEEHNNKVEQK